MNFTCLFKGHLFGVFVIKQSKNGCLRVRVCGRCSKEEKKLQEHVLSLAVKASCCSFVRRCKNCGFVLEETRRNRNNAKLVDTARYSLIHTGIIDIATYRCLTCGDQWQEQV